MTYYINQSRIFTLKGLEIGSGESRGPFFNWNLQRKTRPSWRQPYSGLNSFFFWSWQFKFPEIKLQIPFLQILLPANNSDLMRSSNPLSNPFPSSINLSLIGEIHCWSFCIPSLKLSKKFTHKCQLLIRKRCHWNCFRLGVSGWSCKSASFLPVCGSSICLPILDPSLPVCLDVYSQETPGFLPHHRLQNFQIPSTSSLESLLLNLSKLYLSSRVHPDKPHFLLFMVCLQN